MKTDRRPDVVIIYTDDLGWGDLSCYGSQDVATPHLDLLAERGLRMTQWYVNSPVCSPSRASLLTGRDPAHAGVEAILGARRDVVGLPPQQTLASVLHDAGYTTALLGKWHLGVEPGSAPTERGFGTHRGFRAGCVDYYSHIMYWGLEFPQHDLWDGADEIWLNGQYLTDVITDWTVDTIHGTDGPLFAYVAYNAPHYPMHAPAEWMAKFEHLPWERQVMAAMIACVDHGVGRIVAALEETGRLDDTIILFSSDNGPSREQRNWLAGEEIAYPGGSTGGLRGAKGSLYEGGIRVPTIWHWPGGLPAGVVSELPGQMSDVLPTVLSAIGVEHPADIDGQDLLAQLRGGEAGERELHWSYEGQRAVRRGRWKLVLDPSPRLGCPEEPGTHLYDLVDDRSESRDVATVQEALVADLRRSADVFEHRRVEWRQRLAATAAGAESPR